VISFSTISSLPSFVRKRTQRRVKRAFDIAGASAGLFVCTPILGASALSILATMGRPVFFRQERPGKDGEPFTLLKFRTMAVAKEGEGVESDGLRLTPLGELLRNLSLDELPTLWNVLRGDMSLIGPRPLLMQYLTRYTPEQARRHDVLPGVTGWAQIHGRNAIDWERKFALDLWYVENWSLLLDVRILLQTVSKVLQRDGISAEGNATMREFQGSQT